MEQQAVDEFTDFVREVEPRLKRALVAAFGWDRGLEAAAEALAFAWERWDKVSAVPNPAGYLYGVGRNRARRRRRSRPLFPEVAASSEPWFEPGLPDAVAGLSESQRVAVVLVHGYGWALKEVAELLSVAVPTVQKHVERGIQKLRRKLGVSL